MIIFMGISHLIKCKHLPQISFNSSPVIYIMSDQSNLRDTALKLKSENKLFHHAADLTEQTFTHTAVLSQKHTPPVSHLHGAAHLQSENNTPVYAQTQPGISPLHLQLDEENLVVLWTFC